MGINIEGEQVVLDFVSLIDNETDDENVQNGDDHGGDERNNGDGDGQETTEAEAPLVDKQTVTPAEQNGNDGDAEMVHVPADNGEGTSDDENVQPQSSNEDVTDELPSNAPLAAAAAPVAATASVGPLLNSNADHQFAKPASVTGPVFVDQNVNAQENGASSIKVERDGRLLCFWCEESFIKETSLVNHLASDHGIVFLPEGKKFKKKESNERRFNEQRVNEPGKYVRTMKRKRNSLGSNSSQSMSMAENDGDIENHDTAALQQPISKPERKYAKLVSAPLGRSNSRM